VPPLRAIPVFIIDTKIDAYFARNTLGVSAAEFLFGLGLPLVMESTFLQLFLRSLGASSLLIGLIPTLFFLGYSLFAPLAGFLTAHLERKRPAVIATHFASGLPILAVGVMLSVTGYIPATLTLFLSAYALFSLAIGLTAPTWHNYLVTIFSEKKAIPALAVMMVVQSAAKFISSFFIIGMVDRYAFSARGAGIIFTLVGICFCSGSFMFLITREPPRTQPREERTSRLARFLSAMRGVLRNKRFLFYLASDQEIVAVVGIISFYANYATEYCGVPPPLAAGLFVGLNYLGGLAANVAFGWIGLASLKSKCLISKGLSLTAVALLLVSGGTAGFLAVSFLVGMARSIRMLTYPPLIKRFSGLSDATPYFATAPILTLPLSVGIPLANGAFLDRFARLGALSYKMMFMGMGILIILTLTFLIPLDFTRRKDRG
jgi:MFS family permease